MASGRCQSSSKRGLDNSSYTIDEYEILIFNNRGFYESRAPGCACEAVHYHPCCRTRRSFMMALSEVRTDQTGTMAPKPLNLHCYYINTIL